MSFPAAFSDIRTAVISKVRLDATDDVSRVNDWINQTYADVAAETRCFQRSAKSALTAADASYTLDASVLHIELLTVTPANSQAWFPLKECQLDEILNYRAISGTSSGPPRSYALVGLNQLEFWPTPGTGDVLTTWYSYLPTPLSADADVAAFPEPFGSKLLEYGALVQAAEWKRDIMVLGDFQSQYASWLQAFQRYLNRKGGAYPGAFSTWTRMNPFAPNDPSMDVPAWDWRAA